MTTPSDRSDMIVNDDIELLTRYLNEQLDPERVAIVQRRLEDDPAFREFAAPLLLAWSVPAHWQRHPRPAGELEKHWDEFTKRAGFVYQKRDSRRRRWMIVGAFFVALVFGVCWFSEDIAKKIVTETIFQPVADSGRGWVTLLNGAQVRLDSGADFRVSKVLGGGGILMTRLLQGSALVRLDWKPVQGGEPVSGILVMQDRTTFASAGAEFAVRIDRDTTYLRVIDRRRPAPDSTAEVVRIVDAKGKRYTVHAGESARIIRSEQVIVVPPDTAGALTPIADSGRAHSP